MISQCYDSVADIVIPLTILNFVGTATVILIARCTERWWGSNYDSHRKIHLAQSSSPRAETVSLVDKDTSSSENLGSEVRDTLDKVSRDCDTVAQDLTEPLVTVEDDTQNDTQDDILSDSDVIRQVRDQTWEENLLATRNELAGEQASVETMAGTLISVTKNIVGALDKASHIPDEKKEELSSLLKGVPGFITKIVDMDDEQLNTLLSGNKLTGKEDLDQGFVPRANKRVFEDHKKESAYLMRTLDSLRG